MDLHPIKKSALFFQLCYGMLCHIFLPWFSKFKWNKHGYRGQKHFSSISAAINSYKEFRGNIFFSFFKCVPNKKGKINISREEKGQKLRKVFCCCFFLKFYVWLISLRQLKTFAWWLINDKPSISCSVFIWVSWFTFSLDFHLQSCFKYQQKESWNKQSSRAVFIVCFTLRSLLP